MNEALKKKKSLWEKSWDEILKNTAEFSGPNTGGSLLHNLRAKQLKLVHKSVELGAGNNHKRPIGPKYHSYN